jgi:putative transposase
MLTDSIAIMLRSYTRAINKQEKRSGSLFRAHTKADCVSKDNGITPSFYNTAFGTQIRIPEKEYPQACFNYIHMNPVKAKLVDNPEDWEFSSFPDYSGKRSGKLINRQRAAEFISHW